MADKQRSNKISSDKKVALEAAWCAVLRSSHAEKNKQEVQRLADNLKLEASVVKVANLIYNIAISLAVKLV